jgi:hypothetical protein
MRFKIVMALPSARAIRSNSSLRAADRSGAPFRGFHYYRFGIRIKRVSGNKQNTPFAVNSS